MTTLTLHPACDAFPSMQPEEWLEFVADVKRNGIRMPVLIHHGQVLDGKHRWKAAQELGIDCPTEEWNPNSSDSIAALVTSLNRHRRHMTVGQKAAAAAELEPLYKEAAAGREKGGRTLGPKDPRGKAIDEAARAIGVSTASAGRAKALKTTAPEQFEAVKRGEKTLGAASRESKQPAKQTPPPKRVKPAKLIDQAGREYDDPKVIEALGRAGEFDTLINEVHALKRKILKLGEESVGKELRPQIEADFKNIVAAIRFGTPYTTCVYMPNCVRGCQLCGGARWITKEQFERVPEEDR